MSHRCFAAFAFVLCAAPVYAEQSPVELAIETYKFIDTYESMLQGAINSGSKADYNRFIWQPTLAQIEKWPPLERTTFDKYRACQWAVDSFRVYSQDQFDAAGKMDKTRPHYREFVTRKRECAATLKGRL